MYSQQRKSSQTAANVKKSKKRKFRNSENEETIVSNGIQKSMKKKPDSVLRKKQKKNKRKNVKKNKKIKLQKKETEVEKAELVKENIDDNLKESGEENEPIFHSDPLEDCRALFQWLMYPLELDEFFKSNWEQTPVHIKRNKPKYYQKASPLISTPLIDDVLRNNHILFSKNIDITSYSNGVRETHNPEGRAYPSIVWDYYQNDCSIRLLNPQTYMPNLHTLNATLQELFGCFVGMNAYLTPPNSQGFAPHYDDIEAFILQIEGKKRWRLYKPRNDNEYLPRFSSKNFDPSEIGSPIMDTVVHAGDLLYFPRGTIHQGEAIDDTHSLHVTLSVYQRNSWGDLLEKLVPNALKKAIENDCQFRQGLPLGYLNHIGDVYSEDHNDIRKNFVQKAKYLFQKILAHIDVDKAADEMAKGHMHDFLPPALYPEEVECSIYEDGEVMEEDGKVINQVEIGPDTKVRLTRQHCIRLMEKEGETYKIYYSNENSKEYHEYELQNLEIGMELAPAVKEIILRYPNFVKVEDLPIEGLDNKIQVAKDLWEKCIVITENPLPIDD